MAALEIEVKPLLSCFRKVSDPDRALYVSDLNDRKAWLVLSGVGERRAADAARWVVRRKPELVIGMGYSGGLSPQLGPGEVFLPACVRNLGGKRVSCRNISVFCGNPFKGTLLTMDRVVRTREEKEKLRSLADAVDMESFAIAEVMAEHAIPFTAIRVISDTALETLPSDFTGLLDGSRPVLWRAFPLLLQNPLKILPVIRLGIQSRAFSRRLCSFSLSVLSAL